MKTLSRIVHCLGKLVVFFSEKFSQGVEMRFLKMLTLMFIDGVILHLEKRSFEHFEISFLEKTFYFAYLLTKRENLSHSEAKFICWLSLCMKLSLIHI